jgi:hypothetical protein
MNSSKSELRSLQLHEMHLNPDVRNAAYASYTYAARATPRSRGVTRFGSRGWVEPNFGAAILIPTGACGSRHHERRLS